ncbi:NAD-dependent epimerase/dehydratase family protein [Bradyrhizobium sp. LMG 9283]|uniref:NAD-dependent epimerase/dehydratase family protein n=1 Tax=Bradyrhizobium sp. LMG 9283 TaxID=592064 RepID=UPI00388F1D5F
MSVNGKSVLITGANGFIGRHLAPALLNAGWKVRSAVRSPAGLADEVVIGAIGPGTDWRVALDGVSAVVHLAARVHHKDEEHAVKLYREVNIDGAMNLARQAAKAGVREFIFLSTILVHGRSNDGRRPFTEEDILTPRGLYGMSKAAAEAGLKMLAHDSAMRITVIRPPLVYGAGAKGNFALLTRALKLRIPLPFAAIRNQRAFLAVQNLSSFILQRLTQPQPGSNFDIFLVADSQQVSTPEFIEHLAIASGKRPRLFRVPPEFLSSFFRMIGREDTHHSLLGSLELDISKALATGWRPQVSIDEGLILAFSVQATKSAL